MVSSPSGKETFGNVATPPTTLAVPSVVPPWVNVTIPVGPAPTVGPTMAMRVMDAPAAAGFTLALAVVVVASWAVPLELGPKTGRVLAAARAV